MCCYDLHICIVVTATVLIVVGAFVMVHVQGCCYEITNHNPCWHWQCSTSTVVWSILLFHFSRNAFSHLIVHYDSDTMKRKIISGVYRMSIISVPSEQIRQKLFWSWYVVSSHFIVVDRYNIRAWMYLPTITSWSAFSRRYELNCISLVG